MQAMTPRVSIVIPVYNEGEFIIPQLDRVLEAITMPCEILVVYDSEEDTTLPHILEYAARDARVKATHNTYGRGPANALRFGLMHAKAPAVVVTMADGSDDCQQIEVLARLVERGAAVACASRYMAGGRQVGGPILKGMISRAAGASLRYLRGVGTHDATNSFKAYSTAFVQEVGVSSDMGFEIGLELVVKATRLGRPVVEIPTIWMDRTEGESNFKLWKWMPAYLKWYRFAFGPRISLQDLHGRMPGGNA